MKTVFLVRERWISDESGPDSYVWGIAASLQECVDFIAAREAQGETVWNLAENPAMEHEGVAIEEVKLGFFKDIREEGSEIVQLYNWKGLPVAKQLTNALPAAQVEAPETDAQLAKWALDNGWDAERTLLYDEEGVEGWRWTSPDGQEFSCIGDWSEPGVDNEDLRSAIRAAFANTTSL
jgi:hypothetical protein